MLIIIIAILLAVLYLVIRYKNRYDALNEGAYAPWRNNCPDYWEETKDNCVRTHMSGGIESSEKDFNVKGVTCPDSYYFSFEKQKLDDDDRGTWAEGCGIPWDGYFTDDTDNKYYDIRPLETTEVEYQCQQIQDDSENTT